MDPVKKALVIGAAVAIMNSTPTTIAVFLFESNLFSSDPFSHGVFFVRSDAL